MAGTAMAVPVYEREKNDIAWILTCVCIMEQPFPAVHYSLGRLNYDEAFLGFFSNLQASKVAMR